MINGYLCWHWLLKLLVLMFRKPNTHNPIVHSKLSASLQHSTKWHKNSSLRFYCLIYNNGRKIFLPGIYRPIKSWPFVQKDCCRARAHDWTWFLTFCKNGNKSLISKLWWHNAVLCWKCITIEGEGGGLREKGKCNICFAWLNYFHAAARLAGSKLRVLSLNEF